MGALGIGSDLNKLTSAELQEYKDWIKIYKSFRHVVQKGNLDWLVVPPHANKLTSAIETYTAVTQSTTEMMDESVVLAFRKYSAFWFPLPAIKLHSLIADAEYSITICSNPSKAVFEGIITGGMNIGLNLPYLKLQAYSSVVAHLKKL